MSYAIETKKRKFERILESLADGAASASRTSLNSRNIASSTDLSDIASSGSKRRRITPTSVSKPVTPTSLTSHYLPSSRPAFLERLETYRQVTKWQIPSTGAINASVWTKRGWICVDNDTVFCGSCKERLHIDLEVEATADKNAENDSDEGFSLAEEIYEGLVRRYAELVVKAHAESCPWRKRGCDGSIQRIEGLLNVANTLASMRSRLENLTTGAPDIPPVAILPKLAETHLSSVDSNGQAAYASFRDALRLAVCGWQGKSEDVVECKNCFRTLGLWLYRGSLPTVEHLHAVDSHLEYCPWRSKEAQDTEITMTRDSDQTKQKYCGWELVVQAIERDSAKRRPGPSSSMTISSDENATRSLASQLTPEQKEKKRLDLMQRIKDMKKPFRLKSLLGKGKAQMT